MRNPVARDRSGEPHGHMRLPREIREAGRAVLSGEGLVAHRRMQSADGRAQNPCVSSNLKRVWSVTLTATVASFCTLHSAMKESPQATRSDA